MVGWPESDNKAVSVQLNLTETGTGSELGKITAVLDFKILYRSLFYFKFLKYDTPYCIAYISAPSYHTKMIL